MAEVTLVIGGRHQAISCRDGEEERVRMLGHMLEERWPLGLRAAGNQPGERAMMFVALMLADALDEAQHRPATASALDEHALDRIADRLEALANALEQTPQAT